jgi:hypothetical protein
MTPVHPRELEHQIERRLDSLHRELAPRVTREDVATLGRYHADRLLAHATVTDYVPLLVYRATRDDLLNGRRTPEPISAAA